MNISQSEQNTEQTPQKLTPEKRFELGQALLDQLDGHCEGAYLGDSSGESVELDPSFAQVKEIDVVWLWLYGYFGKIKIQLTDDQLLSIRDQVKEELKSSLESLGGY